MYLFPKVTKTMYFIGYFCYENNLRVNSIRAYLEKFIAIEDIDWNFFISKLKEQVFEKKSDLLKVGDIEDHISFIQSGIVRFSLPMKKEDKEVTFGFCFENEFVSAYDSFLKRTPSLYKIETLTKVSMWSISYDDLQEVYNTTKIGNLIGRLTAERLFLTKSKREQAHSGN